MTSRPVGFVAAIDDLFMAVVVAKHGRRDRGRRGAGHDGIQSRAVWEYSSIAYIAISHLLL